MSMNFSDRGLSFKRYFFIFYRHCETWVMAPNFLEMCDRCDKWKLHDIKIAESCWLQICEILASSAILAIIRLIT